MKRTDWPAHTLRSQIRSTALALILFFAAVGAGCGVSAMFGGGW